MLIRINRHDLSGRALRARVREIRSRAREIAKMGANDVLPAVFPPIDKQPTAGGGAEELTAEERKLLWEKMKCTLGAETVGAYERFEGWLDSRAKVEEIKDFKAVAAQFGLVWAAQGAGLQGAGRKLEGEEKAILFEKLGRPFGGEFEAFSAAMDRQSVGSAVVAKLMARQLKAGKGMGEIFGQGVRFDEGVGGAVGGKGEAGRALEKGMVNLTVDIEADVTGAEGVKGA